MASQPQYNFQPIRQDSPEAQDIGTLGQWVSRRLKLLSDVLKGPESFTIATPGAAVTVKPYIVDQTAMTLTQNCTITLDTQTRRGAWGDLELTQDATGGWTVTFVNLVNTAPVISTVASKRTLIRLIYVGTGWAASVFASGY
jgi:hypothetical protein